MSENEAKKVSNDDETRANGLWKDFERLEANDEATQASRMSRIFVNNRITTENRDPHIPGN